MFRRRVVAISLKETQIVQLIGDLFEVRFLQPVGLLISVFFLDPGSVCSLDQISYPGCDQLDQIRD